MSLLVDGQDFIKVYIDDITAYSPNWKEHLSRIEQVLQALQQAGLTAKLSQCARVRKYMQCLGHMVGNGKVVPEHKVTALRLTKLSPLPTLTLVCLVMGHWIRLSQLLAELLMSTKCKEEWKLHTEN